MRSTLLVPLATLPLVFSCGGGKPPPQTANTEHAAGTDTVAAAQHECGENDRVHTHDLHSETKTEAFAPCSTTGKHDYSGLIKIETVENGVHITIDARDDDVTLLGPEVKERDAVIVYPKGKGTVGVEVPLRHDKNGYHGDKIVFWEDLGKLTDEGTKIHVAIFDHDKKSGSSTEELHVSVNISTGKSCERAQDENPQTVNFNKKGGTPDLTKDQLGAPMKSSSFFASCGLSDSAKADICVAVKNGKPLGVSVSVTPANNKVAACIDRSTRRLSFPVSEKLDVVHQKF